MDINRIKLKDCWKQALQEEFGQTYMKELKSFLVSEYQQGKTIYPAKDKYFEALNLTGFNDVKVVILGQDPYHNPNQAHGLSFSVRPGVAPPPSLMNIYKELEADISFTPPKHGYLKHWAKEGVLLLNSILTVEANKAGSHQKKGWESFTDAIIKKLDLERSNLVFILWGSYAQKKGAFIDKNKHLVLSAVHPSPLSAYRGFFGCKHFSKANEYLSAHNLPTIDWSLPK